MLDLHLKYDPNVSLGNYVTGDQYDPEIAASYIKGGLMPQNLVKMTEISTHFRDAVIGNIVTTAATGEQERTLQLLSAAIAGTPDGMENTVRAYSEYLAPLAFAWGETVLATRAVLRNEPSKAGNFLSTVANALNKKMNSDMFYSLIVNSTSNANDIVALERAQGKY
jgi:hypothetical protein